MVKYTLKIIGNFLVIINTDTNTEFDISLDDFRFETNGNLVSFITRSTGDERRLLVSQLQDETATPFADLDAVKLWLRTKLKAAISEAITTSAPKTVIDETNLIAVYLKNGGSEQQAVDGSTVPVEFSYTPPAGYNFLCKRIVFFIEGLLAFEANSFGDLVKLTNGWAMKFNGVEALKATDNKDLGTFMFDMHGLQIYGKVNKTAIGRFSFDKLTPDGQGVTIRDGQSISTLVQDDLSGLVYLEAKVMGTLSPV